MAATLALTSSGSISPVSDLDAVPWGGSLTGARPWPLPSRWLPGLERRLRSARVGLTCAAAPLHR